MATSEVWCPFYSGQSRGEEQTQRTAFTPETIQVRQQAGESTWPVKSLLGKHEGLFSKSQVELYVSVTGLGC